MQHKERIPVLLLPIGEIDGGVGIDRQFSWDHFDTCWSCGSPYMVIKISKVEEEDRLVPKKDPEDESEPQIKLGCIDHEFTCAVCGTSNGGIYTDNDKYTAVRDMSRE